MTGNPEVIVSSFGLVPPNALVLPDQREKVSIDMLE